MNSIYAVEEDLATTVYIELLPGEIAAEDWRSVYAETLALVSVFEGQLVRRGVTTMCGASVPAYVTALEHAGDDGTRWSACGDLASLRMAGDFTLRRDMAGLGETSAGEVGGSAADLVLEAVRDGGAPLRMGGRTEGEPFERAVLAACLLIETRLPRRAMVCARVSENDIAQARAWAAPHVGPLAVPVRHAPGELVRRLAALGSGAAVWEGFAKLYQSDDHAVRAYLSVVPADGVLEAVREVLAADERGVVEIALSHVASALGQRSGVTEALRLLCIDPRGPQVDVARLLRAVALDRGVGEAVASAAQSSLPGAHLVQMLLRSLSPPPYVSWSEREVAAALPQVFPERAERLLGAYREQVRLVARIGIPPGAGARAEGAATLERWDELQPSFRALAAGGDGGLPPGVMSALFELHALAIVRSWHRIEAMEGHDHRFPRDDNAAFRTSVVTLIGALCTLTERAWHDVATAEASTLRWLAAAATIHLDPVGSLLSRAMLENPAVRARIVDNVARLGLLERPTQEVAREVERRSVAVFAEHFGADVVAALQKQLASGAVE